MSLDTWLRSRADRCSQCGFHPETQGCACAGQSLKIRGQAIATAAHPTDRAKVAAAIRQLAAKRGEFSSNDARKIHGVSGPVVGAAFSAAAKAGLIVRVGYEPSTDPGTHAHPVAIWKAAA